MNTLDRLQDANVLEASLTRTREEYRPFDPGSYLYHQVLAWDADRKYTRDFIELVYVTLAAWNMNSRGARLSEFETFRTSLMGQRKMLERLEGLKLKNLGQREVQEILRELFLGLELVADGKPPLVTFSKTLHFFFPDLVGPIDRTYTLNYFYGHSNLPAKRERQFDRFLEIELEFARFAGLVALAPYRDRGWNLGIPKIIDNAIIGWMRGHEQGRG